MVEKIPPTPDQILNQKMYDKFKSLDPILSHNPSHHEKDPIWTFNSDDEAQNFVSFFKDIWNLGEDRIATYNENVPLVLEGFVIGSRPRVVVKLDTNLPYVEGQVDAWAQENGVAGGRRCVGLNI